MPRMAGSAGKQKILSLDGDGVMYWPTSVFLIPCEKSTFFR